MSEGIREGGGRSGEGKGKGGWLRGPLVTGVW